MSNPTTTTPPGLEAVTTAARAAEVANAAELRRYDDLSIRLEQLTTEALAARAEGEAVRQELRRLLRLFAPAHGSLNPRSGVLHSDVRLAEAAALDRALRERGVDLDVVLREPAAPPLLRPDSVFP